MLGWYQIRIRTTTLHYTKAGVDMLRAPNFTVRVTSPFRALPKDRRAELVGLPAK